MSNTSFTAGPWEIGKIYENEAGSTTFQIDQNRDHYRHGLIIAHISEVYGDGEENNKDALLIAAAPDLLEALQELCDAVRNVSKANVEKLTDLKTDALIGQIHAYDKAKSAISKALGQ